MAVSVTGFRVISDLLLVLDFLRSIISLNGARYSSVHSY